MSSRDSYIDVDSEAGHDDTHRDNLREMSEERDSPEANATVYDLSVRMHRIAAEWRTRHAELRKLTNDFFGALFDRQDKHEFKLDRRHDAFSEAINKRFDRLEAKLDAQKRVGWVIAAALVAMAAMMYSRGG